MDRLAFEPIFQQQIVELMGYASESGVIPPPAVVGRKVFVRLEGIRQSGRRDSYLAVIDGDGFPLYPFDVGFADPDTLPEKFGDVVEIKNSRYFPYDGETKFKTEFAKTPSVFVCIQPGFSQEYFIHHTAEQWNPHAWPLARVVHSLVVALQETAYQCPNAERL